MEKKEHLFKVLLIGEPNTGKTSLIRRYVHNVFTEHYRSTIGVDFGLKVLDWDQETVVRLQLWDIAGQERLGTMTRVFYREAVAAFIVYDVLRPSTLEGAKKWKYDLDSKLQLPDCTGVPCILLANKSDLLGQTVYEQSGPQLDQICRDDGFVGWFETSAKDNINIEEAANFLVEKIIANTERLKKDQTDSPMQANVVKLDAPEMTHASKKSDCSC